MLIFYFQIHKYMLLFIHTFIKYYKVETNETENGKSGGTIFLPG